MDKLLPSIKQKYKDRLINREKQWPPCHSNKLVRLELVEREKGDKVVDNIRKGSLERRERKARFDHDTIHNGNEEKTVKRTPLAYGDLFKVEIDKKPVRKVLVEGDAGIGKTTLSVSISEDWSCEKLFQEFELVLLLPLRHKKVTSAGSLPELLKLLHPSADVCKSVASYLEEEEAKKVLVIADGWDELSESERQEESFLYELLFETFPLMSVVVTSRPSASAPLHRLSCIDRFVEINGFGKDDIKEYIHCEFSSDHEKARRLLEQLEDNPLVESVCSVPLNCAIVCHLWRTSEEALPSTMTQLYTKIILNVILRNIRKKDSFTNVLSLPNFEALPKELQQSFRLLCKFAYKALKENRIVFSQEELVEFFPQGLALDENILCFGLLQSAETVLETGHGVSFHFLHLTFMEYLAALHLSVQPQSTLLEIFNPQRKQFSPEFHFLRNFNIVLRFLFGISFSGPETDAKDVAMKVMEYIRQNELDFRLSLCRCAFESQNYIITHTASHLARLQSNFLNVFDKFQSAYDFAAVLHVMLTVEEYSTIGLNISHCGVRENQIRRLADIIAGKQGKLRVYSLDLSGNKLTGECVSDLFNRASASFIPDEEHNDEDGIVFDPFSPRLSTYKGLLHLNLSDIALAVSELQALKKIVYVKIFSNLEHLNLKGCLTGDADTNATSLTTFIEALSINCLYMKELNLSYNNLGVPGASAVARGVSRFKNYLYVRFDCHFKLYLDNDCLGDRGLIAFIDNLDGVYNFSKLSLSGNSIHAAGVSYLAESVCSKRVVMSKANKFCELSLSDNPLGLEGTTAVGKMLSSSHCQFVNVNLSKCKLTTAGSAFSTTDSVSLSYSISSESAIIDIGQQLCVMPHNRTMVFLDLSGNSFTGECIHILVGIMRHCVYLKRLLCTDCNITSDDLILLLDKISQLKSSSPDLCSQLFSWDLSNNKIDDRGALAPIDYLPAFPCLGFYLHGNPASSETTQKLYDEMTSLRGKVSPLLMSLIKSASLLL